MKTRMRQFFSVFIILTGLFSIGLGSGLLLIVYEMNLPSKISNINNTMNTLSPDIFDYATDMLQGISNTVTTSPSFATLNETLRSFSNTLDSTQSMIDVVNNQLTAISDSFYQEALYFWDWNILLYHPETTTKIGDTFYTMTESLRAISPSLHTIQGNLSKTSNNLDSMGKAVSSEIGYLRTEITSNLGSMIAQIKLIKAQTVNLKMIALDTLNVFYSMVVYSYLFSIYFLLQGASFIMLALRKS